MTETKRCTKCCEEKPLNGFYLRAGGIGYQSQCKECVKAACRERYRKNPKRDRDRANQINLKWKQNHPDAVREDQRRYRRCVRNLECSAVGRRGAKIIIFKCEVCGSEFRHLKSRVDSEYRRRGVLPRFCSRACYYASMHKDYKSPYARKIERIKKEVVA